MSKNFINKKHIKVKKQKIIGKQKYINSETGEVIDCLVVEKNIENDYNFHKIWINDLMSILDLIGGKKLTILNYLLKNINNNNNMIITTYRKISKELNISLQTVTDTMKILQESNFIKRVQNGVYMINPDIIVKGNSNKRQRLLIEYVKIGKDNE